MQRAENKKMVDQMFPFLVKNRIPDDPKDKEMALLGPGSYLP